MTDKNAPMQVAFPIDHLIDLMKWRVDPRTEAELQEIQLRLRELPALIADREKLLERLNVLLREAISPLCSCIKKRDDSTPYICLMPPPPGGCTQIVCDPFAPCPSGALELEIKQL